MNSALSRESISLFESIKQYDENGNEYWTSRDLSRALEYADYRNFIKVMEKAKTSCANSGQVVADHFGDVNEMVIIGSGAPREIDSVKLSRYACYLIVQNADPSKEIVAQGQTYFAIQTRIAEVQQMEAYQSLPCHPNRGKTPQGEHPRQGRSQSDPLPRGAKVRQTIKELGDTMPEDLPVAESIKIVEKKKKELEAGKKELPDTGREEIE